MARRATHGIINLVWLFRGFWTTGLVVGRRRRRPNWTGYPFLCMDPKVARLRPGESRGAHLCDCVSTQRGRSEGEEGEEAEEEEEEEESAVKDAAHYFFVMYL